MRIALIFLMIISLVFFFFPDLKAQVITPQTLDRFYDPVEMRAENLNPFHNIPLDQLVLYACHDARLEQIPYQFDEWTPEGAMIFEFGEDNNADRSNRRLDPQDMLVFMARDMGDQVAPEMWQELSRTGVEIEVVDPLTKDRGWVYLLHFPDGVIKAEAKYTIRIVLEADEFKVYGDTFTLFGTTRKVGKKTYQTIVNRNISIMPKAGGDGKNFIDRSKLRISASFLFGFLKIRFNEDNFIGGMAKYKAGPVRGVGRHWISMTLPLNIKAPRIFADVYVYDTMIFIVGSNDLPFDPGFVMTEFKISAGYDLHEKNGLGMKYYSNINQKGFVMDGRMSDGEKDYSDAPDNWRCIVGPNGWMMQRSLWDGKYKEQADIRMKYLDDVNHKSPPDYFEGDLGYYYTLSTIKSLKPRKYKFQLDFYWPYHFCAADGPNMKTVIGICNIRDHALNIKVGNQQMKNQGADLTPLEN